MRIINDEKLLDKYCEQNGFKSHFSSWDMISKKLVSYKKGEYIALFGTMTDKLFFLVEGSVKFTSITNNYDEIYLYDIKGTGMFGAGEYTLDIPSTTQSVATEDCLVVQIPVRENRRILDNDCLFQRYVAIELAERFISVRERYETAKVYPLDVRLARYILNDRSNDGVIENLKKISDDINSSYRQIMRVFNRFCETGCLEHLEQKGKYAIKDKEALVALIENADK